MKKQNSLDSLLGAAQKESAPQEKKSYVDERLWKPTMDKSGNGYAVIRFLPAPTGEDLPWVKLWNHAFQGPTGQWYIENSLTTLGKNDPVSEYNSKLWNSGVETDKEIARKQKRKLQYFSNIYVVSDPKNPENEGKVFLYKYGKKIFDKLVEAMQPAFADETPIDPFNFWKGADFKLKITLKDGYWNYDKSEFDSVAPLLDDDDALEAIWKKQYSLAAVTAADQFKSYDDLQKRLKYVLGQRPPTRRVDEELEDESEGRGSFTPNFETRKAQETVTAAVTSSSDDEEDALSYFQKLAEE